MPIRCPSSDCRSASIDPTATATNKTLTKKVDISSASEKIIVKHIIINCTNNTTME